MGNVNIRLIIVGERVRLRRDESGIVMMGVYEFLQDWGLLDA